MEPPFPCPTKTWHNDTYAAIDPKRQELSAKGKKIIVTGGGTGISRETTRAFATAGTEHIVLLGGRRETPLKETKKTIEADFPDIKVAIFPVDITTMRSVTGQLDKWDVLVLNAGFFPTPGPFLQAKFEDEAHAINVNLLGNMRIVHLLLPMKMTRRSFSLRVVVSFAWTIRCSMAMEL